MQLLHHLLLFQQTSWTRGWAGHWKDSPISPERCSRKLLSGLQAGNAAVDAVWLGCVDTENMQYQYVGGEARDDQIQQLHLGMFVGIPSLRPWAHTDNRGLAGGGVLFSMSDQCHREILEHM